MPRILLFRKIARSWVETIWAFEEQEQIALAKLRNHLSQELAVTSGWTSAVFVCSAHPWGNVLLPL